MAKLTLTDIATFVGGSAITTYNNNLALIEAALENTLSRDGTPPNTMSSNLDMNSNRILNLIEATQDTEPVRLAEFNTELTALETTVSNWASTAQGYANAAEAALDELTDIYLGAKASDPSVDNDGAALSAGDLYFNTVSSVMKVYSGTVWVPVITSVTGSNLDDFADVTITAAATGDILRFDGSAWVDYPDSNYQPVDATLTALAGVSTAADKLIYATGSDTFTTTDLSSFARTFIDDANASAVRTTLGLAIGTDVQAYDAELAALAGLVSAADSLPYFTGSGTAALTTLSSFGRTLIDDAAASNARSTLELVIGTNVQAWDADLDSLVAGNLTNVSAIDATTESTIEAAIDTLANLTSIQGLTVTLADAGADAVLGWDDSAAAYENLTAQEVRDAAGLGTANSPQFTAIELGHATDTTIARVSAGVVSIEGVTILTTATGQPLDSDLTDIAALTTTAAGRSALTVVDNNLDQLLFWDDSAGTVKTMVLADMTAEAAPASGDYLMLYGAEGDIRKVDWSDLPGAAGGISNVSEDLSPTLGGNLEGAGFSLGTAVSQAADVFLEEGGVINFDNGDITLTQTGNILALAGGDLEVPDEAYDATGWNGDLSVPTKNAIRDKIETLSAAIDIQTFTASGTWNKPASGTMAFIQLWGAGGSGGKNTTAANNAAGGGGGGYTEVWKKLSDLGSTETVTIGAGGAARTGASLQVGAAGGSTTFGTHATAYGGGGGSYRAATTTCWGGYGGSYYEAGTTGTADSIQPGTSTQVGGGGPVGWLDSKSAGDGVLDAYHPWGGGAAAGGSTSVTRSGKSVYGGGAGGTRFNSTTVAAGTSVYGGNGGAAAVTGNATAGTQPGGGGGGCSSATAGHSSGAGGDGKCVVYVF